MKRLYTFCTLFFLCFQLATAQEGVEKHIVKRGETIGSIAKHYNMTPYDLQRANPGILEKIALGDTLLIAKKRFKTSVIKSASDSLKSSIAHSSISYTVKSGDTKYSLAKRFGLTIQELVRQNPHITNMLIVGHTIKATPKNVAANPTQTSPGPIATTPNETVTSIKEKVPSQETTTPIDTSVSKEVPSKETNRAVTKGSTVDGNYVSHKIQPQETLFGLAKKAGMSIAEFLVLNPELKASVQIGTFIKMPKNETVPSDSNTPLVSALPKTTSRYVDLKLSASATKSKKLLFVLPFSQTDYNNQGDADKNFKNVPDTFMRQHLEFYKGARSAIDSIRELQLNLKVDVIEVDGALEKSTIMAMAKDNNITQYDAIILPFYEQVEEDLSAFTAKSKIPVITASAIAQQKNTNTLYNALPSVHQQRLKVLDYMVSKQANIIVLSDMNRAESRSIIANRVPQAEFVTLKKNGTFNESELIDKFKKDQHNFVVLDTERNSVFLSTTTTLLSESSNYDLQLAVLENSLIPDTGDVSQKRYQILKMIFPSLTPAEETIISKQFTNSYQKKYNLQPSTDVMLGFDITFDTLLRLMQDESFENSAKNDMTEYTTLKFNYKKNTLGGFSNEGIYILQYDANANIKEAN